MYHLRDRFEGGLFATILDNGLEVVWRPLNIGEFIEYDKLIKSNRFAYAYLEDEIFKKCVKNTYLVDNIGELPAGVVSAVVVGILQYSGPSTTEELNYLLNVNRAVSQEILHQIVSYICQAFPAYKPDDIYLMDYEILMLRLAQAEDKMSRLGILKEPIVFYNPGEEEVAPIQQKRPTENLLEKYYKQEGLVDSRTGKSAKTNPQNTTLPTLSKPDKQTNQTIISTNDIKEHQMAYVGHEAEDKVLLEHSMVEQTAGIYKDYLVNQAKNDGKLVIKTPEERKAQALERAKEYEQLMAKVFANQAKEDLKLQEMIKQKQASKKAKVKRRR